ncbi:RNA polymerase sigma factor [Nocardioides pelophilus]|uniref:RNA polymerase sigma factor n=1 Tax=Nocardioides pelophilus TaxID=2172019 RepID=UPI001603F25E|nr:sigma-70 family RNA polymerase sigma factor [Nocardioides pelophilus]
MTTPATEPERSTDETEAVRRAQAGDRDAFADLVAAHAPAATRAAAWFGAGPDVDDVVQEAFVKAWQALDRFRPGAPFRPWLVRIVANQTRNTVRGRRRRDALAVRALDLRDGPDPALDALAAERQRSLLAAVRSLRPAERDVVVCRWLLGLTEAETATALGIPAGTAKSRASRALARLRAELTELEVSHDRG